MKKRILSILLSLSLISTMATSVYANEIKPDNKIDRTQIIQKFNTLSNGNLKISQKNGQVFLSGKLSSKQPAGEKSAINFLDENSTLFGIKNTADELTTVDVKKDNLGDTFVKFAQKINGIKVNNNFLSVHFDKNGVIVSVNGKLTEDKTITYLGDKTISDSNAIDIAKKQYTYKSLRNVPKAEKLILNKDNKNYEVFKVNISYTSPKIVNNDVYIEAHSGKIIQVENNIKYDGPVTGTGIDVLGKTKNLNLYLNSGMYDMADITKPSTREISTYSLNHGTTGTDANIVSNNTNNFASEDFKSSVSAHYNAGKVIDFYKNLFNRNSLDNNGMPIYSLTHYDTNYNNAFWDGYEMVYGDGDGTKFTYLSGDLDVVGHEMSHGLIDYTANLQYHNQSGALNESMADVFGVMIATYDKYNVAAGGSWTFNPADWVIGENVYTPNIQGDALRSLSDPTLYGQPDNMNTYNNYPDTEQGDWGGVHINSGIPNKAAYLIAKSIGMEKTARIYYRALEHYMAVDTDFSGTRECLKQAASDLYGINSAEVKAIDDSFNTVGIQLLDPYEANDTIQTAYPINMGTEYNSYISTSTDVDYYGLSISNTGNILISLSNLAANYGLELYNAQGQKVAETLYAGSPNMSIKYNVSEAGNYYIKVFGNNSNFSTTQKYALYVSNPVTGISLDKTTADMKIGDTINLSTTISPSDASNKSLSWSTSDSKVATVDNSGKVAAIGLGTAKIEVSTVDGNYKASCTVNVIDPVQQAIDNFVTRFYVQCLNRQPDSGGLLYYRNILLSKSNTGAGVAYSFIFSPEFISRNVSDDAFLDIMYNTFFNRVGDSGGLAYWKGILDSGMSRLYVLSCFVNSPEFGGVCAGYGIDRGSIQLTKPADLNPTVTAFTNRFYVMCLNRTADDMGLNYWVNELVTGNSSGADISKGFVLSPEFISRNVSDNDFITVMYRVFFNRLPDSGGQAYWLNRLHSGTSRKDVLSGFIYSQEFSGICTSYGIKVGV